MTSASVIKGFCPIEICWQFLYDLPEQIKKQHERGLFIQNLSLQQIEVQGRHFRILSTSFTPAGNEATDVWKLGAIAFELMIGSPVLNGMGPTVQCKNTPIPALCGKECAVLNQTLQQCLNFDALFRPTLASIQDVARKELGKCMKIQRPAKIITNFKQVEMVEEIDRKWPDKMGMLVRKVMCILLFPFLSIFCYSQSILNSKDELHTKKMIEATLMLRSSSDKAWKAAEAEFAKRLNLFTLTTKIKDSSNECPLIDSNVKHFGVNRMLNELKKKQLGNSLQNTGRGLLDGVESKYNYLIFEKGIKKGSTATYQLSGLRGKQVFAIVPYASTQSYKVELSINGKVNLPTTTDANGITYFVIDVANAPKEGDILILKITNNDKLQNKSFVVINHNYRN
jgi:hypothetical protein